MNLLVKTGETFREATREEIVNSAARFLIDDVRGQEITPDNAAELFRKAIGGHDREHVIVGFLDVRGRVLSMDVMFTGTIDEAPSYHREVARRALILNAAAIVIAHNHPSSQKAIASEGDKKSTLRLAQALGIVGIQLAAAFVVTPEEFAPIKPPDEVKQGLLELLQGLAHTQN